MIKGRVFEELCSLDHQEFTTGFEVLCKNKFISDNAMSVKDID